MGKIFCIMGKSSSGKDTLYKLILADPQLGLKKIVPYTTRPIRFGETDGMEYFFVDESGLDSLRLAGKVIEIREYQTVLGVWKYFTVDDGQIDLERYNYIVIGTLEVYQKMKSYFGEEAMVPIYVEVDDAIRYNRALHRESQQQQPMQSEVDRRFLADNIDFSEEKLKEAGISIRFMNEVLENTKDEIKGYIKLHLQV